MAFFHIDDQDVWGQGIADANPLKEEGGMDGITLANFVLGKSENNAPVATLLRMDPGYVLPRHGHDCYRFEVVVQGSITVGDKTLGVGALMLSEPGNLYGPHIAGPEGCTTIEIFSTFDAVSNLLVQGPDGVEKCDTTKPEGAQRMMELVREQELEKLASA
ncbi:hypothetical protein [Mycolicibacterium iranicum]|uniref:hypothetical protein n=1 Tax=Mycolicibacterium iranicum TaxID=912594 RepID=UPI000465AF32|nr:hypothetical protein [Mycolicibacterium iranicum]